MDMNQNQAKGATMTWISQQQRRVESQASGNQARLRTARTLADVVRLADVAIPAEIRFMKHSIPGLRSLEVAVARRLDELVDVALMEIASKETATEARAARGRFILQIGVLRGAFARQYRRADAESSRLVYQKDMAEKAAAPPAPPEAN
jgi:hypothetical protein